MNGVRYAASGGDASGPEARTRLLSRSSTTRRLGSSRAGRDRPWIGGDSRRAMGQGPSQGDMEMTRKFAVLAAVVGSLAAAAGGAPADAAGGAWPL
jgi:hypothetical protein